MNLLKLCFYKNIVTLSTTVDNVWGGVNKHKRMYLIYIVFFALSQKILDFISKNAAILKFGSSFIDYEGCLSRLDFKNLSLSVNLKTRDIYNHDTVL